MSQEVALQLIVLCGTFITSLTTVVLAWIAMQKSSRAVEIGESTHTLMNSRFDEWQRQQQAFAADAATAAKAKGNLEGRAALQAEQDAARAQNNPRAPGDLR